MTPFACCCSKWILLILKDFITRGSYSFLREFWKEAKNEEWASQLDIHKYKLARLQAQNLNKWTWFLNSRWNDLKMMLSTLFRIMSDLYHSFLQVTLYATTLQCCCQTPLKSCTRGFCSWGFSPQHTSCATWRYDGAQITVTVFSSFAAPLPPELASPTSKYLTGFNIHCFFHLTCTSTSGKNPCRFRLYHEEASQCVFKFEIGFWSTKQNPIEEKIKIKKKNRPLQFNLILTTRLKQINKQKNPWRNYMQPGQVLHHVSRHQAPSTGVSSVLVPSRAPRTFAPLALVVQHLPLPHGTAPSLPRKTKLLLAFSPPGSDHRQVRQNWPLIRKLFRQQAEEKCSSPCITNTSL